MGQDQSFDFSHLTIYPAGSEFAETMNLEPAAPKLRAKDFKKNAPLQAYREQSQSANLEGKDAAHVLSREMLAYAVNQYIGDGVLSDRDTMEKLKVLVNHKSNLQMKLKEYNRPRAQDDTRKYNNDSYIDQSLKEKSKTGEALTRREKQRASLIAKQVLLENSWAKDVPQVYDALVTLVESWKLTDQSSVLDKTVKEKGKLYKPGQFIPGGQRAPSTGVYVLKTPKTNIQYEFKPKVDQTAANPGNRASAPVIPQQPRKSTPKDDKDAKVKATSDPNSSSGNTHTKTYKGGQFMPGGGRAPAGGATIANRPSAASDPVPKASASSNSSGQASSSSIQQSVSETKTYKGGQFMPGGQRAPAGGITVQVSQPAVAPAPVPAPAVSSSSTYSSHYSYDDDDDSDDDYGYGYSYSSYSSSYDSGSSAGKFYKGGQFIPGGGRAPAGGGYY